MEKHTAGEDVITVIRASSMETFCLFHRTGLALLAVSVMPAQDAHTAASPRTVLIPLNTETGPFSGDSGGDAPPLIRAASLDAVPGES